MAAVKELCFKIQKKTDWFKEMAVCPLAKLA